MLVLIVASREYLGETEPEPLLLAYIKTCVKRPLSKRLQIGFKDQLSLDAGQKNYRMLH